MSAAYTACGCVPWSQIPSRYMSRTMDSPHLKYHHVTRPKPWPEFRHATRPRRARHGAVSGWVRQRHGCLSGMGVSAALGSQRQGCVNGKGAVSGYNSLLMMLMVFVFLKCVYTIQLIVQPVVQLVLLCKRCFISRPILCYVIGINIICFFYL